MADDQTLIIIPLRLEDLFARVQADRIFNWNGYTETSFFSEDAANAAVRMESGGSRLFLKANNMFGYLFRNISASMCSNVVNIIIPGLRNLYWQYRHLLPANEQNLLAISMQRELPSFTNIYSYRSLQYYGEKANISEYQLLGSITPYDVVHVPVEHFIDLLNRNQSIKVQLSPLPIIIDITYHDYDFWDNEYQKLIRYIDIPVYCRQIA